MFENFKATCPHCGNHALVMKKFVTISLQAYACSACKGWLHVPDKPRNLIASPELLYKHYHKA